jgi:hypothetical protein
VGLRHPVDLAEWLTWQRRQQHLTRRVKARLRPSAPTKGTLWTIGHGSPKLLAVADALTPTVKAAILNPALRVAAADVPVTVLASVDIDLSGAGLTKAGHGLAADLLNEHARAATVALSLGPYLALGAAAFTWCERTSSTYVTVQHGLLTPHAPPLARGTRLLAWSEADGQFWRSGREDISVDVVGSPLLWEAASAQSTADVTGATPLYLGQLHGAELPREEMADAARRFCLATGAAYRPHPSETDRRSRAFHAKLKGDGVDIENSGKTLAELARPVVSVFSTGILEAAVRGLPAWADFPDPPPWLEEFWTRYGMQRWGGLPTPPPPMRAEEPSSAIAHILLGMMDG